MSRRLWLPVAVLAASLAGGGTAMAQEPAPEPTPPASQPDLVLSGRDVRMTRVGVLPIRVGCRQTATPGEICAGTLTVRLREAVEIVQRPPGSPPGTRARPRRIAPYTIGTLTFSMSVGSVHVLRLQVNRLTGIIVRQLGSIRVRLIGLYHGRTNVPERTSRTIRVYYPTRPEI